MASLRVRATQGCDAPYPLGIYIWSASLLEGNLFALIFPTHPPGHGQLRSDLSLLSILFFLCIPFFDEYVFHFCSRTQHTLPQGLALWLIDRSLPEVSQRIHAKRSFDAVIKGAPVLPYLV